MRIMISQSYISLPIGKFTKVLQILDKKLDKILLCDYNYIRLNGLRKKGCYE